MGNGQSQEGYRAAEGRGGGSKQARHQEEHLSYTAHIHAQAVRITVAQQQSIQRLHQQNGTSQARQQECAVERETVRGDTAEVAHAPQHIVVHTLLSTPIIEQLDDAAREMADDHSCDEQGDGIAKDMGESHEQHHDQQSSCHGSHDDQQIPVYRKVAQGE